MLRRSWATFASVAEPVGRIRGAVSNRGTVSGFLAKPIPGHPKTKNSWKASYASAGVVARGAFHVKDSRGLFTRTPKNEGFMEGSLGFCWCGCPGSLPCKELPGTLYKDPWCLFPGHFFRFPGRNLSPGPKKRTIHVTFRLLQCIT